MPQKNDVFSENVTHRYVSECLFRIYMLAHIQWQESIHRFHMLYISRDWNNKIEQSPTRKMSFNLQRADIGLLPG